MATHSVTPYTVPIACGGGKEGLTSAIEALQLLESISVAVFDRLSGAIAEQQTKLTNLDSRAGQAAGIVSQVRGRTSATTVLTPAQLPAAQEESRASLEGWFNVEGLRNHQKRRYCEFRVCSADEEIAVRGAENIACASVNNPMERPHEALEEIFAPPKKRMISCQEGLGRLPDNLNTVSSLLVFDSFTNPYKVNDANATRSSVGMKSHRALNSVDVPHLEVADEVMLGGSEVDDVAHVSGSRLGYGFTPQPVPMSGWALPKSVPGLSNVVDLPWEFDAEDEAWAPIAPAYGRSGGRFVQSSRSSTSTEACVRAPFVPSPPPIPTPVPPPPLPVRYQTVPNALPSSVIPPPPPLPLPLAHLPQTQAVMPANAVLSSPPPIPPRPVLHTAASAVPNIPVIPVNDILGVDPPLLIPHQPRVATAEAPTVAHISRTDVAPEAPNASSTTQTRVVESDNRTTASVVPIVIQGGPPTPLVVQAPRPPPNSGLFAEINALGEGGAMRALRNVRMQLRQQKEKKEEEDLENLPIMRVLRARRGQVENEDSEDESQHQHRAPVRRRAPPPPPPRPAAPVVPVVLRPRRVDDMDDE